MSDTPKTEEQQLANKLKDGCIQMVKRWSGDVFSDCYSYADEPATDALMAEAAETIARLERDRDDYKAQRDRLVDHIGKTIEAVEQFANDPNTDDDHRMAIQLIAEDLKIALAAVKGGSHE